VNRWRGRTNTGPPTPTLDSETVEEAATAPATFPADRALPANVLYYGDNLDALRHGIPSDSIDLIYLDPPFNSDRSYSAIFADESGRKSDAQLAAFEDSWHWGPTAESHYEFLTNSGLHKGAVRAEVSSLVAALRLALKPTPLLAYLVEMTVRLVEMRRVLKPTGSLWIHCDPTASHYLKVVLDAIFLTEIFRNEVIWRRTGGPGATRTFGPIHDTLLFDSKTSGYYFRQVKRPYMRGHVERRYRKDDKGRLKFATGGNILTGSGSTKGESGQPWQGFDPSAKNRHWAVPGDLTAQMTPEFRKLTVLQKLDALFDAGLIEILPGAAWPTPVRYFDDQNGQPVQDIWAFQPYTEGTVFGTNEGIDADVKWLGPTDPERLGWQTQKPIGLLERVIESSCPPDGIVLDPFCGCGTALVAAQKLGRRWIGIDITYLAIGVMKARLRDSFPSLRDIPVIGKPTEVEGARMIAESGPDGRYQFQWWAIDEIGALPAGEAKKKGSDLGVDGRITFTEADGSLQQAIVSVKSGKPKVDDVRVLKAVIGREKAAIGILVSLDEPTKPMRLEATVAGVYHSDTSGRDYPKIQLLSAADLLERHVRPQLPPLVSAPYQRAKKIRAKVQQTELFDGSAEDA
jgi:DNA modification methylase